MITTTHISHKTLKVDLARVIMNRSGRRRSLQLQQTVRMKLAVVEKQKEDIAQIIDEYASEVVANAQKLLTDQKEPVRDLEQYQEVLQKLDQASEVLTQVTIQLDSILDPEEESESNETVVKSDDHKIKNTETTSTSQPQQGEEKQETVESVTDNTKDTTAPIQKTNIQTESVDESTELKPAEDIPTSDEMEPAVFQSSSSLVNVTPETLSLNETSTCTQPATESSPKPSHSLSTQPKFEVSSNIPIQTSSSGLKFASSRTPCHWEISSQPASSPFPTADFSVPPPQFSNVSSDPLLPIENFNDNRIPVHQNFSCVYFAVPAPPGPPPRAVVPMAPNGALFYDVNSQLHLDFPPPLPFQEFPGVRGQLLYPNQRSVLPLQQGNQSFQPTFHSLSSSAIFREEFYPQSIDSQNSLYHSANMVFDRPSSSGSVMTPWPSQSSHSSPPINHASQLMVTEFDELQSDLSNTQSLHSDPPAVEYISETDACRSPSERVACRYSQILSSPSPAISSPGSELSFENWNSTDNKILDSEASHSCSKEMQSRIPVVENESEVSSPKSDNSQTSPHLRKLHRPYKKETNSSQEALLKMSSDPLLSSSKRKHDISHSLGIDGRDNDIAEEIYKDTSSVGKDHGASPIKIRGLKPNKDDILAVTVSHMENPWSFYIQLQDFLKSIAREIRDFVEKGYMENIIPVAGMFCLAKFNDNEFYRSRILSVEENESTVSQVKVLAIDHGKTSLVPSSSICRLHPALGKQPCQALFCALSGLCPKNPENLWTEDAILQFQQYIQNAQMHARLINPSQDNILPHIIDLIIRIPNLSRNSPEDLQYIPKNVASVLVTKGYAKPIEPEVLETALRKFHTPKENLKHSRIKALNDLISNLKTQSGGKDHTKIPKHKRKTTALPLCFQKSKSRNFKDTMISSSAAVNTSGALITSCLDQNANEASSTEVESVPHMVTSYELGAEVDSKLHSLGKAVKLALRKADKSNLDLPEGNSQDSESDQMMNDDSCDLESVCSLSDTASSGTEMELMVMISAVISPGSFFVHPVNSETGHTLDKLFKDLNTTFESHSTSALERLSASFSRKKNSLCCALFSHDGFFYRGLVLDTKPAAGETEESPKKVGITKLLIFFMDYGDFEWVAHTKVFPLPDEFRAISPMALWCTLSYVKPKEDPSDGPLWPAGAVNKFKSLVSCDKELCAVISEGDLQIIYNITNFQLEPLPVYLVDKNVSGEEICLNHELIQLNVAALKLPTPDNPGRPCSTDLESLMEDWDPMSEEFTSIRNSYKVNTDDPGVALVGYVAGDVGKEGQKVCVFYNRPRGCFRGDRCPNLHIKVNNDGMTYDKVPVVMFEEDQSDLLPEPDTLVAVSVSTVISPGHFYVTLPWGRLTLNQVNNDLEALGVFMQQESLEGLMDSMQEFYQYNEQYNTDLFLPAPGQAMAAKVRGLWSRVKVTNIDVERGLVQVMSVDFGSIDWVDEKDIRELDLRFIHLTLQAVECSLADLEPVEETKYWSQASCEQFADLVRGKVLVALIKHRYPSGRISVHLYNTGGIEEVDLNKTMVTMGLAKYTQREEAGLNSKPNSKGKWTEDSQDCEKLKYMPA